jgi:hypothetical protein
MRDASTTLLHASRIMLRCVGGALLLAMACVLSGCASDGSTSGAYAMASPAASDGATIAFESIDGPPPQVFDRLVGILDSETKLRNLSIISREAPAAYRVRSYLQAQVVHGRTMIAWVWDVYDHDQQRALRLTGEEPAGKGGRDPWAAADDMVLRKIAQAGLSGLSNMINGTPADTRSPAAPAVAPDKRGPAVASTSAPASPGDSFAALGYTER